MTRSLRRIGSAVLVAGAMVLAAGAPAVAQEGTVPINEDHMGSTAADFMPQQCDGPFADLAEDEDGWHFVLRRTPGTSSCRSR